MIKSNENTCGVTWIILNAVKDLSIGKYKLAEFLKGSKAKDVAHLSGYQGYGGLLWCDIGTIMGFVEQMEEMELIKRQSIDIFYSVLELTEAGKKVLDEKIQIELQIIKKEKLISVGDSEKLTLELFRQGRSMEEMAKERNLVISTIYSHLHRLVAKDYLSCSEFVPKNIISQIIEAKNKLPKGFKLKEIKDAIAENISYDEIKCVLADKNISMADESKKEDEFWSEGYFSQNLSSEYIKNKMQTFRMKHDEEMNYNCKECNKKISAHNKDWHDNMCDDCFNNKYFPEE